MKRIVLLLVMLFMAHVAESANVLWNKVSLVRTLDDPNVFSLAWVDTKWGAFNFVVYCDYASGTLTPMHIQNGTDGVLYEASYGSIVNDVTSSEADPIFAGQDATGEPVGTPTPLTGVSSMYGGARYLAFALNKYEGAVIDWVDGQPSVAPDVVFGWVSIGEEDGVPVALRSAIDLDGGPMIVGGDSAIPEPSSASLLLVGGALLALRRRFR